MNDIKNIKNIKNVKHNEHNLNNLNVLSKLSKFPKISELFNDINDEKKTKKDVKDVKDKYKKVSFLDEIIKVSTNPFSSLPENLVIYYINKSKITSHINKNTILYNIKVYGFKSTKAELKKIITWMKQHRYPDQVLKIENVISKMFKN